MYTNSKLAKSVRLALMYGAAATAFGGASVAVAQDADEDAADRTERIQVTGSRIQRTDMEQAVPVTVIDREAIDLSGEISVTDVIRNTTFNSAGSFRPQSGSAAQGTATVSMRGLGSDRTLVLLDGRRLPKSPATGSGQDLNVVPLAAVERIEILSDGASAVYGSDAIGGVINIVTRRDFTGAELRIGGAEVSLPSEGGDREEGSAVFGTVNDTTRLIGGISWNKRDIIFENAYPWVEPGASIYGNNYTETNNAGGFRSIPGEACGETENFYLTESGNPESTCAYNFNATNANEASTQNHGLFLKADHQINDDWNVFLNANYSKADSFGRYAPPLNDPGSPLSADSFNNPTNPESPLYKQSAFDGHVDGVSGNRDLKYWHRFSSIGNRDSYVDNYAWDLMLGAEGRIGNVDVDFGVRKSNSKSFNIGYNYLLRSTADELVNITTDEVNNLGAGDVYYDLRDPLGSRYTSEEEQTAYETMIKSMNVTINQVAVTENKEVFGSAAFDVFEVGAGMIQAVVGAEYREEDYTNTYDSLSEAGVVGGSAGNSAGGGRDITSAYAEVLVPVTYDFELSFAARMDDYSDYGNDFSPKVAFRWQPMDELVLRGSYGQGFRAPTLDQITQAPSSGNPSVSDPATCLNFSQDADCNVQVRQLTIANPDLESEESEQFALGMAYQPTDWLNMAIDYWNIEITNRIAFFGANTLLNREAAGEPIPAGLGVNRNDSVTFDQDEVGPGNPVNPIVDVVGGYGNDGTYETDGLDLNFRTNFDFGDMGRLNQNLQVSYTFSSSIDGGRDQVENPGVPAYRATLSNSYSYADFSFAWNMNVIGSQYDDVVINDDGTRDRSGNIATWVTHDLQATYHAPWDGRITVGMQNAFEKEPQLRSFDGRSYNFNLYDAFGRVTYVRYTQRF